MHRTLSAYVARQIIPPFLVGLFAFTLVFLTGRIVKLVELVVSRGASAGQIAKLFALILPTLLETTVPMAFLLAILYGCGRLTRDNETLAFKACGVGPFHFLAPVALVALAASTLTLGLSVFVRPAANLAVKQELYSIAQGRAGSLIREGVFNDFFPDVLIYVDRVIPPGNTFQGVMIVDQRDRNAENLIIGRVALLLSDSQSIGLRLYDGMIHERRKGRGGFSQTSFNVYNLRLELGRLLSPLTQGRQSPEEMSLAGLRNAIRAKSASGENAVAEIMERHRRYAIPFAPLVFALLGVAIVLTPNRSRASRAPGVTSCLAWLFAYYAVLSLGMATAEAGKIPAAMGPWLPNILVGLVSIYLFVGALRLAPEACSRNDDSSRGMRSRENDGLQGPFSQPAPGKHPRQVSAGAVLPGFLRHPLGRDRAAPAGRPLQPRRQPGGQRRNALDVGTVLHLQTAPDDLPEHGLRGVVRRLPDPRFAVTPT